MPLKLVNIEEIAPKGDQAGTFTTVAIQTGKDEDGVDFKHLVSGVELDAKDSAGNKFQLTKVYNINNPRGVTAFKKDFKVWSGRKLTDQDLASFDAEKLMHNQPVKLVVKHRQSGKKIEAVIEKFLRTVSLDSK